jgi:hypothetical protein
MKRKIEDLLGEDPFGIRRGQGNRDAKGMLRIITEQTLDIDKEICACFIHWYTASDHAN